MAEVTVMGEKKEYPKDTTLRDVAEEFQPRFRYDILLAKVDGRLTELHHRVRSQTTIEFLTAQDSPGYMAYERSAVFVMLKAFYDVAGAEKIDNITVEFSFGDGLFISCKGDFTLTKELLAKVRDRMGELVKERIPIRKRTVSLPEAMEIFHKNRMYEKERLFAYRRTSRVNLYSIGDFDDYFYGYMTEDTGYIRYFDLQLYADGFLLLLPSRDNPEAVAGPADRKKLFETMYRSTQWGNKMHIATVGELNDCIVSGRMNDMILIQEAVMEKEIGDIAQQIAARPEVRVVMIAGPTSSGKTTFSHRLSVQLKAVGLDPHPISVDNYFLPRDRTPRDANGDYDFECLEAIDLEQFNADMTDLIAGKRVALPTYDFITGLRTYNGETLQLRTDDILVIEGIHCLNEAMSYALPRESKFKIYISALTQINVDEHNRIFTNDGRLLRRIVRDARTRGASAQKSIGMWPAVRRGEEQNIFPYQEEADVMFNSALIYELAVLKPYVEPLLFAVPEDSPEYIEANRLLKFLDYFLSVTSENIPVNSLIREFIGGGCFKV